MGKNERKLSLIKVFVALLALTVCQMTAAANTTTPTDPPSNNKDLYKADENFECPEDCHCVLAHHTHQPFLHAKCSSLKGLKSEEPLKSTLPIHSIDLSYLNLTRLSHALEKLHDLTSINLSHNELHEIGHLGRRIKKLNLKHNRFNSAKLSKLPAHVQSLNLQHNDITYLPLEFTKLSQLQSLELSHNQINCSCETLEVRNWLQERHVFMEHPVTCTYPASAKGKPWLQLKQSDICAKEKHGWHADDEENELMMGDQPIEDPGNEEGNEELGKDYLPIGAGSGNRKKIARSKMTDTVEGSGDLSELNIHLHTPILGPMETSSETLGNHVTDEPLSANDDDDGSGSGDGLLIIPHLHPHHSVDPDDFDDNDITGDIFGDGLGIFKTSKPQSTTDEPVKEDSIVPVEQDILGSDNEPRVKVVTDGPEITESIEDANADSIKHANGMAENGEDSNATYFLLGVVVLIIVGLLAYVALKRCKKRGRGGNDAENPQTELLDMDKKQLGKPIRNGVPEHVPLIGEKAKADLNKSMNGANKKPYDAGDVKDGSAQQEPLLNGNNSPHSPNNISGTLPDQKNTSGSNEPSLHAPNHEYYPISPRYPTPQSPRASKYGQQQQVQEPNNNDPEKPYLSSSPKSGRYSPVYSPETGRVKIKLSETPRPKTPMLVTRSRSNAGEIITTPIRAAQLLNTATATPLHTAATNGHIRDHH
uniref:LRRCT domain-containing protein n=1 Tax=Glossina pallidipes TaxID=7398 RepID=A0A1B0AB66_GLOPL